MAWSTTKYCDVSKRRWPWVNSQFSPGSREQAQDSCSKALLYELTRILRENAEFWGNFSVFMQNAGWKNASIRHVLVCLIELEPLSFDDFDHTEVEAH